MRKLIAPILFLSFFSCLAAGEIPSVPTSVEIAGVKLKITSDAQEEIQKDIDALRASDKYFRIKLDRINLYFPIIERILAEEGIPDDIKYLMIQESSGLADAKSSAGAVGYWQFKDFTAREVGLRVDSKIDERKNIVSATHGAAEYFKRNNYFLNNWIYAVNAYMTGAGGVKKYVEKEGIGSKKLVIDKKTHWYVKRFIAHVLAFRDEVGGPNSEGLKLREYTKGGGETLESIAKKLDVDLSLMKDYNKWLIHGRVPTDKEYTVIIPTKGYQKNNPDLEPEKSQPVATIEIPEDEENSSTEETNTSSGSSTNTSGSGKHNTDNLFVKKNGLKAIIAQKEDDAESLAEKAHVLPRQIVKYNDLSKKYPVIVEGEIYYAQHKKNRSKIEYYVAQPKENLWEISQRYGIKLKKILKKNRMKSPSELRAGRVLWLKHKRPKNRAVQYKKVESSYSPSENSNTTSSTDAKDNNYEEEAIEKAPKVGNSKRHTVKAGESLWAISQKYNVTIIEIDDWNNLNGNYVLRPGQVLQIYKQKEGDDESIDVYINDTPAENTNTQPVAEEKPSKKEKEPIVVEKEPAKSPYKTHTIQEGESLWAIAKKYNISTPELMEWNNLTANSVLQPGQKLAIREKNTVTYSEPKSTETEEKIETIFENTSSGKSQTHIVQAGESLWSISRKYGVSTDEIMQWNKLESNSLQPGQVLSINSDKVETEIDAKAEEPKITTTTEKTAFHTVKAGESLWGISRTYNLSVDELVALNDASIKTNLQPGQKLKVAQVAQEKSTETPTSAKTYIVKAGDSLYGIARAHDITVDQLKSWNNKKDNSLSVGEELIVSK